MTTLIGGPYNGKVVKLPEPQPKTILMPLLPTHIISYIKETDKIYRYNGEYEETH